MEHPLLVTSLLIAAFVVIELLFGKEQRDGDE